MRTLLTILLLLSSAAAAQTPPPPIGAFWMSEAGTFASDHTPAVIADYQTFGANVWTGHSSTQQQWEAWQTSAQQASARLIFPSNEAWVPTPLFVYIASACRAVYQAEDTYFATHPAGVTDPLGATTGPSAPGTVGNAVPLLLNGADPEIVSYSFDPVLNHGADLRWNSCGNSLYRGSTVPGVGYQMRAAVRLRVDEANGPTLAVLRGMPGDPVLATFHAGMGGNPTSLWGTVEIRVSDVPQNGGYFTVPLTFLVPLSFITGGAGDYFNYRLNSSGVASLLVDRFRMEDWNVGRLFGGGYDATIKTRGDFCTTSDCFRNYFTDEPYGPEFLAYRYIDSVMTEGWTTTTARQPGMTALIPYPFVPRYFALIGRPRELLIDPYVFGPEVSPGPINILGSPHIPATNGILPYNASTYNGDLRVVLNEYTRRVGAGQDGARAIGVPLWVVLQDHGITSVAAEFPTGGCCGFGYRGLRPPTSDPLTYLGEQAVQGFLAVAYGTKGFMHYAWKTLLNVDGVPGAHSVGLTDSDHSHSENSRVFAHGRIWTGYATRWEAARRLNGRLSTMLTALNGWDGHLAYLMPAVPPGAYVTSVVQLTPMGELQAEDVHIGQFSKPGVTTSQDARFIVVNRRCRPEDTRQFRVTIPTATIHRTVTDLETNTVVTTLSPSQRMFTTTIGPCDARLFRVTPGIPNSEFASGLPTELALGDVWPNPTASAVTFPVALPAPTEVRVVVFDALGREVAVVTDGPMEPGFHDVRWDASALAAGVYVVRMSAGDRALTRLLTVAR